MNDYDLTIKEKLTLLQTNHGTKEVIQHTHLIIKILIQSILQRKESVRTLNKRSKHLSNYHSNKKLNLSSY